VYPPTTRQARRNVPPFPLHGIIRGNAKCHAITGDKDAAADDFERAIAQDKDDPDIYYHRAQLHFILGEWAEAAKDYQKSIDLDRTFIYSHIQLGVTQYKLGSVASALATFRRSVKNFEDVPDVYNYFGELYLDQQNFSEAIQQFDKAVEIAKQNRPMGINVLPLINKALALFQWKHDFQEAENLCQKALISTLMIFFFVLFSFGGGSNIVEVLIRRL
jgi:mitochondrial import receptor subunit TOM70